MRWLLIVKRFCIYDEKIHENECRFMSLKEKSRK